LRDGGEVSHRIVLGLGGFQEVQPTSEGIPRDSAE